MLGNNRNYGNDGKNERCHLKLLCNNFCFSGLGDTLEESTNEIEIWVCRVYSNKTHISILFVVTTK